MRAIKFKVNRQTLNQIYISYMRPTLEYASVVWDGCTEYEKTKLEQLQYEAARIVTGLTRSVSIEKLIKEVGWISLANRHQKLVLMYKVRNNMVPEDFVTNFPRFVGDETNMIYYHLRNADNYATLPRTTLYSNSFIPSATAAWNSLQPEIKSSPSISILKNILKK
jgi:hypothetical protein